MNAETKAEIVIIQPDSDLYILDICQIPTNPHFFLLHTGNGLVLVNTHKYKTYQLAADKESNFQVCHSLTMAPFDPSFPDLGFWLC